MQTRAIFKPECGHKIGTIFMERANIPGGIL